MIRTESVEASVQGPVSRVEEMARTRGARRFLRVIGYGSLIPLLAGAFLG